jgi:hypothetical protein
MEGFNMSLLQEMEKFGLADCSYNHALSILDVIRADIFNYTDYDAPDSLSNLQGLKSTLEDPATLESIGITEIDAIRAALVIVNKNIDTLTEYFDNVIFPKAVDFIDQHAKPAVNQRVVIMEVFDSYEDGNSHYELGGQFTKSNNPEIFMWENL